ncbi:MAG: Gfo/Idh/MocA family oxidoreductase [Bacteroidota bacterium]
MAKDQTSKTLSRRAFVEKTALGAAGFTIVPRYVLGGPGYTAPSDKLNIAAVGVGGRGNGVIRGASGWRPVGGAKENVVALCDVDQRQAANAYKMFRKAKRYEDFRVMLEEMKDDIDAVTIATPDHTHAVIAMAAMQMGKHVYVEKPLTHSVHEARTLTEAARRYGVITQMGNQGNSGDDIRRICEWIWADLIGEVTEVHCWTNRPVWPQGLTRPTKSQAIPKDLNWDLWLGPAPERPYHETYLPFSWRGWWDFGTGALGDMACHVIDPAFEALKLGYPDSIEAQASTLYVRNWEQSRFQESPPPSTQIRYEFPARDEMPAVSLTWYDGGLMPWRPAELKEGEKMGDDAGGVLFIGSKGKLMCDTYGRNPRLLPLEKMSDLQEPTPTLERVPDQDHQKVWVEGCKTGKQPSSNFDYAGPLTETVLMGNLGIRSFFHLGEFTRNGRNQRGFTGRKKLLWDGKNMRITNFAPANQYVQRPYRKGWSLGE